MELRKFTRLSLFLAMAVVLNIMESMIPLFNGYLPGLKLGLANIVTLLVLYTYSFRDTMFLSVTRVFLVGILRTGILSFNFFFSLGGAIFSTIGMFLVKKWTSLSVIGVSLVGSILHTIGQILVAALLFWNNAYLLVMPWMILFSIPTGLMVGFLSKEIIKYFENKL